jgi:hypothetical protein
MLILTPSKLSILDTYNELILYDLLLLVGLLTMVVTAVPTLVLVVLPKTEVTCIKLGAAMRVS